MDITMCLSETCPSRTLCHRHEASGTSPSARWQSYADFQFDPETGVCDSFWRTSKQGEPQERTPL